MELHREVRRALARLEEAKTPIAQEFTEQLQRAMARPLGREAVPLGSRIRRGVRGPRRVRRRRGQSALGRRPVRDPRLPGRRRVSIGRAGSTTVTSCSSSLAAACCTTAACSASSCPTASRCPSTSRLRRMLLDEHDAHAADPGRRRAVSRRVSGGVLPLLRQPPRRAGSPDPRRHAPQGPPQTARNRHALRSRQDRGRGRRGNRARSPAGRVSPIARAPSSTSSAEDADAADRSRRIDSPSIEWSSITDKGRGVEIGKTGEVASVPILLQMGQHCQRRSKGGWPAEDLPTLWKRVYAWRMPRRHDSIIAERPRGKTLEAASISSASRSTVTTVVKATHTSTPARTASTTRIRSSTEASGCSCRQTGVGIYGNDRRVGNAIRTKSVFTWKLRSDLDKPLEVPT